MRSTRVSSAWRGNSSRAFAAPPSVLRRFVRRLPGFVRGRPRSKRSMQETIDLIAHRELRNLRAYTKETGQPTKLSELDLGPMTNVQEIELDEEHITVHYNTVTERKYNANEVTRKEWVYKYNDDPEFV